VLDTKTIELDGDGLTSVVLPIQLELYTGRAVRVGGDNGLICFWGNAGGTGSPDVFLYCASGFISAYRVNASDQNVLLGTAPVGNFTINTWHWLEARCKMSTNNASNDGIVEVWLNGQLIISNTSCTTKRSNTSTYYMGTNLITGTTTNTPSCYWDDIYILDTTGSAPWNTRLGDCRIATIKVNADAGPNQGVVASGNSNHYVAVSDVPYDSADYITLPASSSGSGEIFGHATLPSTNTFSILATAVVGVARKTDAGNSAFKLSLKTGSNTYNSNTQYLSTSNAYFRQEWVTNPNTSSQWTVSEWANTNIGIYEV